METKTTSAEIETLYGVQSIKYLEMITILMVIKTVFGVQEITLAETKMESKVVKIQFGAAAIKSVVEATTSKANKTLYMAIETQFLDGTTALVAMETLSNERIDFYSYLII